MRSYVVRAALLLTAAVTLAACGSDEAGAEKLAELEVGMSSDSLFQVLGNGPISGEGADTARVRSGYRMSRYFVAGQLYTVIYVREVPGNVKDFVEQKQETPIVLDGNGRVTGWGWKYYVEEAMPKLGLPTPLIDTTTVPPAAAPNADSAKADSAKANSAKSSS